MGNNGDIEQRLAKLQGQLETLYTTVDSNRDKITSMERRYYIPQASWKMDKDDAKKLISENIDRIEKAQHALHVRINTMEKNLDSHSMKIAALRNGNEETKLSLEFHVKETMGRTSRSLVDS
jgi:chromosome segregation ATPase